MFGTMRLGHPENHPSQAPVLFEMTHPPGHSDQHCFVDRVESGNSTFEGTILSRPQLGSQGRGYPKWRMRHAAFVQFSGIKSFF